VDITDRVHDEGDESVADLLKDLSIARIGHQVQDLRQVEMALQEMGAGNYGVCIECGCDIPFPRLKAYPVSRRCIVCQEMYEKTYAHVGRPTL
jgi:RNA polymerase-binding transcription factor DksA